MAAVVHICFNPTNGALGSGIFLAPANSRSEVTLDDATGLANYKTLLDGGCILYVKSTANRNQHHARLRRAGLHFPGS